jgi:hypothetical protein
MDPFTAAGLGLSVASLVLQLFAGCIKGYQIFIDAAGMPVNFEHLRVRMRIEQVWLLNWGEKVGILEEMLEQPSVTLQLHRNLVIDILLETQLLFKGCLKIEAIFDNLVPLKDVQSSNATAQNSGHRLERCTNKSLTKTLKALEKTTEVPKRLQWATVKQDRFENLVEKLISYNNSIVSLLDRTTIQQLYELQVQSQLVMLQLSSKIDDLKQLALAMQVQTHSETRMSYGLQVESTSRTSNMAADQLHDNVSFARLASFKAQQMSLELRSSTENAGPIDRKLINLAGTNTTRVQAFYKKEHVWVEWKEYNSTYPLPSWNQIIEDRVKKLAALLGLEDKPKEFRAPRCLGYFHDQDEDTTRYGLIYSRPDGSSTATEPQSLFDLIREGEKPSLTQRVVLANTIARSLMYLHSVNWLHKGLRSDNIVFFAPPGRTPNYSIPNLSGFDYARPDLPEELTEKPSENFEHDIYRHPHALDGSGTRSKKSWDIYSLGIVLVEIAYWRTIGDIVDVHVNQNHARSKLREVKSLLLQEQFLIKIGVEAGERYKDVVRRCIAGGADLGIREGADESEPDVGADMQQVFSQAVVGKLQSIQL